MEGDLELLRQLLQRLPMRVITAETEEATFEREKTLLSDINKKIQFLSGDALELCDYNVHRIHLLDKRNNLTVVIIRDNENM